VLAEVGQAVWWCVGACSCVFATGVVVAGLVWLGVVGRGCRGYALFCIGVVLVVF